MVSCHCLFSHDFSYQFCLTPYSLPFSLVVPHILECISSLLVPSAFFACILGRSSFCHRNTECLPAAIADEYFVQLQNMNGLLDYYVQATDAKGNVKNSAIYHVFVNGTTAL